MVSTGWPPLPSWFQWVNGTRIRVQTSEPYFPASTTLKSTTRESLKSCRDDPLVLLACFVAVFASFGLHLVKIGHTQRKNVSSVVIRTLLQFSIVPLLFWAVGFALVNGDDRHGFVGLPQVVPTFSNFNDFERWCCQCAVLIYCRTIISSAAHGSNYVLVDIVMSLITATLLFPFPAFWCWNSKGWLYQKGYRDEGGAGPVFLVAFGASFCLITLGKTKLRPRLRTYVVNDRYVDPNLRSVESVIDDSRDKRIVDSGHNIALFGLGAMMHLIGSISCLLAAQLFHVDDEGLPLESVPRIVVNAMFSASTSGLTACFLSRLLTKRWSTCKLHHGIVAGVAVVSCGGPALEWWHCALLGIAAGLTYVASRNLVIKMKLEDSLDVLSACGPTALLGLAVTPLILNWETKGWVAKFAWNVVGGIIIAVWSFSLSMAVFFPLRFCKLFKQRSIIQQESGGLDEYAMREQLTSDRCITGHCKRSFPDDYDDNAFSLPSSRPAAERPRSTMPRNYAVSHPRLISTTSDIPSYRLASTVGGKPDVPQRRNSLATFDSYASPSVHSMSALSQPPMELIQEKVGREDDPKHEAAVADDNVRMSVTNSDLHNQLMRLKPPEDGTARRPSLSVRRKVTPLIVDRNNNNNNNNNDDDGKTKF